MIMSLAVLAASAQVSLDSSDNHPYFGVRASLDITAPGDLKAQKVSLDVFNPGAGFSIGAIYNIPVVANLYFEPGLSLFYNTSGLDLDTAFDDFEASGSPA